MHSSQIPSSGIATSTRFGEGLEASYEPLQKERILQELIVSRECREVSALANVLFRKFAP